MSFGRFGPKASFVVRILLAAALSPPVLVAEFYALRLLGLAFETVVPLLVVANLAALPRIVRAAKEVDLQAPTVALAWLGALALPVLYLAVWMWDPQVRANWGHAWTHTDIAYLIAGGQLRPEEPQLAGVGLAYPWAGHVFQSILSRVLDRAPAASYIWSNLAQFAVVAGIVVELVRRLSGGRMAKIASVAWVAFGINIMGLLGQRMAPASFAESYPIWGDFRFTPWLRKFGTFNQTVIGIGLFSALLLVVAEPWEDDERWRRGILVAFILLSLAVFYPILFVAGVATVAVRPVAGLLSGEGGFEAFRLDAAVLGGALLAVGVFGILHLQWVTGATVGAPTLGPSNFWWIKIKALGSVLMLTPFLIAIAWVWRDHVRGATVVSGVLLLAAAGSVGLYVLLDIFNVANEYKFMFTAAVCLAPFPAIATERLARRVGGVGGASLVALVAVLLALPAVQTVWSSRSAALARSPAVDVSGFSMALGPGEELSEVTQAIRRSSPATAFLVTRESRVDLVALTQRANFVLFGDTDVHGIALPPDYLLERTRGYPPTVVEERRRTVTRLFEGSDEDRSASLEALGELGRPFVVISNRDDPHGIAGWLRSRGLRPLETAGAWQAWLIVDRQDTSEQPMGTYP